jgi:hypothetical protein
MQRLEVRDAVRVCDDRFAIQDQAVRRQRSERIGDRLEAPRPIIDPPGVDGRPPLLQVRLRAVASNSTL